MQERKKSSETREIFPCAGNTVRYAKYYNKIGWIFENINFNHLYYNT